MSDAAPSTTPVVASLRLADEPEAWTAAGFTVDDDGSCRLGHVRIELAGPDAGRGLVSWALRGLPDGWAGDLDGFPTTATEAPPAPPADHPSSAVVIDHVVLLTDDMERTVAAAGEAGLTPRRWRDHALPDGTEVRQAFFRLGEVVLELVAPRETPPDPRPGVRTFGLAVTAVDVERARRVLGERLGPVRPAVQPGRLIATLRHRELGLTTPVALMSPPPKRGDAATAPSADAPAPADAPPAPATAGQGPGPEGEGPAPDGPFRIPG